MWKRLALILFALFLFPYALAIVYRFGEPSSTVMLFRQIKGEAAARSYAPISAISPLLVKAVATSEDSRFCRHIGIDFGAIREAIERAQKRDQESHGASTLTQQTAKNLFLWQGRSWLRKILEAPLALWLTLIWPKQRVMEVYLNVVEWGDGVFGVEEAARHAFKIGAAKLDLRQAALLATALPNPRKRDAARPSNLHRRLAERLLAKLAGGGADIGCVLNTNKREG